MSFFSPRTKFFLNVFCFLIKMDFLIFSQFIRKNVFLKVFFNDILVIFKMLFLSGFKNFLLILRSTKNPINFRYTGTLFKEKKPLIFIKSIKTTSFFFAYDNKCG